MLDPWRLSGLFGDDFGEALILATTPSITIELRTASRSPRLTHLAHFAGIDPEFELARVARQFGLDGRRFSLLLIADSEVRFLSAPELKHAKIAAISFFSSRATDSDLADLLDLVVRTDYEQERRIEQAMLATLDSASSIRFTSERSSATFAHQAAQNWFSLAGPLGFGQQTILPTGELSTLRQHSGGFDDVARLALEGSLLFRGVALVHRGSATTNIERANTLQRQLTQMMARGAIAHVEDGAISQLLPLPGHTHETVSPLEDLLNTDPRYRLLHEIGFGLNVGCTPLRQDNWHPNERHPCVHFGIGLGGFTDVHIDLICPDLMVVAEMPTTENVAPRTIDLFAFRRLPPAQ